MLKHVLFGLCLLLSSSLWSQGTITGQITDAAGESLPGATVLVLENGRGAAANDNGVYTIEGLAPGDYTLRFSYVGYENQVRKTQVVEGTWKTLMHVQLTELVIEIDELIVSATRAGKDAPFSYTNLDKEQIEENNLGQDVPFLLQWTPGAVVTSDAGTGIGYTGIRIRGSDPTRVNVTINGIPLNDAESQGVFWVDLPDFASSTDDIQIQRGVGTSTNGAGAFGGTINLNTTKLKKDPYARIGGTIGSFNTTKANVQFGSGLLNERFTLDGRLSRINSDGYIDRATADLESFYFSGAYVGDRSLLRLNVFSGHEITYQAWNGVDQSLIDDPELRTTNTAGTEKAGEPHEDEVDNYTQTHYQLLYNLQANLQWNINLAAHYTRGFGYFEQYKASQFLPDYQIEGVAVADTLLQTSDLIRRLWLDNHFFGGTFSAAYTSKSNRVRWTTGGAWNRYLGGHYGEVIWARLAGDSELGDRYYENDATKTDFNIYSKLNYQLTDPLSVFVDLQYRLVDYEFLGIDINLNSVTQRVQLPFFNPKAGVFYQINEGQSAYASFAVGNREPNRNDFVGSSPENRPNSERLYDTELGWRWNGKTSGVSVNGYYMVYQDQLVVTGALNEVGELLRTNVPDSYRLGLEVAGQWNLGDHFTVRSNLALSQNRLGGFTAFFDDYDADFNYLGQAEEVIEDAPLPFSPSFVGDLILEYRVWEQPEKHQLGLSLLNKYVSKQYIDVTGNEDATIDPYFFSNLRLQYSFDPEWLDTIEVNFLWRNLLNSLYETNGWSYVFEVEGMRTAAVGYYPQATTNFLLGISFGF